MATLNATYFSDFGRVRLELSDLDPNVVYSIQRSTALEPAWVDVRGATALSDTGTTQIDDFEYTPNILNSYRVLGPVFHDAFMRSTSPLGTSWGTADTGQVWVNTSAAAGAVAYSDNGTAVTEKTSITATTSYLKQRVPIGVTDAEVTYSGSVDTVLAGTAEFDIGLRSSGTVSPTNYEGMLLFNSAGSVIVRMGKMEAGAFTPLTGFGSTVGTWNLGVPWHARFRVEGTSLMIRAWEDGNTEPTAWTLAITDTSIAAGTDLYERATYANSGLVTQRWGPIHVDAIPTTVVATATVIPVQTEVYLKSITFPSLNRQLDCVDWKELTRNSRVGLHDVKGRHEILAISDVGSSATFSLTLVTRSKVENRALVALLTYGGTLLLQPPGDIEEELCPTGYAGTPGGYVAVGGSSQRRTVYGQPIWTWTVEFTRVAAADLNDIVPTMMTWEQLWAYLGDTGSWEDVWATWATWQDLWNTPGSIEAFEGGA